MRISSALASGTVRFLAGIGLASAVAIGCSSSSGGSASDGGAEGSLFHKLSDAATDDGGPTGFDGTSGRPCTTDGECKGPDGGGSGFNVCSSNSPVFGGSAPLEATPVCIVSPPTGGGPDCDPAPPGDPTGGATHFCDGPDLPSSPGLCLPVPQTNPQPGRGLCLPKCTFPADGSAAVGCVGKDVCFPIAFDIDQSNHVTGVGFCQGFCEKDSDCSAAGTAGLVCQTDTGACVAANAKITRTKRVGDACTQTATARTTACTCSSGATNTGYCTTACVVGGAPCPNGWICDNGTPSPLTFQSSTQVITVPVTTQNPGTLGTCFAPCGTPADGGTVPPAEAGAPGDAGPPPPADGGAACPGSSTCQSMTVAGAECLP